MRRNGKERGKTERGERKKSDATKSIFIDKVSRINNVYIQYTWEYVIVLEDNRMHA